MIMKRTLKFLTIALLIGVAMSSCTVHKASKTPQNITLAPLERHQYTITDDLTAEVTIRQILGLFTTPKVKYGSIKDRVYYAGIPIDKIDNAEALVTYKMIMENPDLDFLVSPRYEKKISKAIFVKSTHIKLRAKGIKIKGGDLQKSLNK